MRHDFIRSSHDLVIADHQGVEKTCSLMKIRFYWSGMVNDVKKYIRTCPQCQMRKVTRKPVAGVLHPLPVKGPFETVAVNLLGSFPQSTGKNRYIAVVTNFLTKYAIAGALPDQSANSVTNFYVDSVILAHGAPRCILTGRGNTFVTN